MKYGVMFANSAHGATPEGAAAVARAAEDLGYESIWTVDHVVVPAGYQSAYPYSSSGKMPGGEDQPMPDPLIWLSWVGAMTTSLRLGTGILILPQRNPVILAKETATLDALTGGRLMLGVGIGWLREEFDAIGVPFAERAARTDESIEVLRSLWRDHESSYDGRFTRFEGAKLFPKPAQPGGPPIIVGGHSEAAARRAGRLGDGFFPGRGKPETLAHLIAVARGAAVEAGRDPDRLEITVGGRLEPDAVRQLHDLGVDRFMVPAVAATSEQYQEVLGAFAENVIATVG